MDSGATTLDDAVQEIREIVEAELFPYIQYLRHIVVNTDLWYTDNNSDRQRMYRAYRTKD